MICTRYWSRWSVSAVLTQKTSNHLGFVFRVQVSGRLTYREGRYGCEEEDDAKVGKRARCTVHWLSHRAPLCPHRAAIVPENKALIQHILSPRESSGNRRRRPSPPIHRPHSSSPSISPFVCLCLPRPLFGRVTSQQPCIKENYRTMWGPARNLESCSFFLFILFL